MNPWWSLIGPYELYLDSMQLGQYVGEHELPDTQWEQKQMLDRMNEGMRQIGGEDED